MVIGLPQGETSIGGMPQWGGAGGGQQAADVYAAQFFQQLFGRLPSQQELSQYAPYFMGADPNIANVAGGQQAISSYANQLQQAQQAPQMEAQALQQQIPLVQNLINQQSAATTADLTNPQSPTYQSFSGLMNNMGITPSSGAFQSGLGGAVGQAAAGDMSSALGGVGLPIASGYSQGAMAPFQQAMNQPGETFTNNLQMQDMIQQMMAASGIAQQGAPSALQKDIGMASGASQAVGGLGQGIGLASLGTSYICKELIRRELLRESDMDDFHIHIMPAMFKKGRAFWKYAMDGYKLVKAVNRKGLDWKVFKPLLFDRVMEEKDPCKAVDLYADACHQLCISSDPMLWDKRVYRTSFWDSFLFLPMLFIYPPFLEALWKCVRFKLAFVMDKPNCEE